jgi:hypothetical protein
VLELVGPDGRADQLVCQAAGYIEDNGRYWEPSPYAEDLTDGRQPPWRLGMLGGGPDGDLTARYASVPELVAAVRADPPRPPAGDSGRFLYLVLRRFRDSSGGPDHVDGDAVFLTRQEAEERIRQLQAVRAKDVIYSVDVVTINM